VNGALSRRFTQRTPLSSSLKQTRLILIRHGQVHADWSGLVYGCHEVRLSEHGQSQARLAAERLSSVALAAVISSPLSRARYGADAIMDGRSVPRHSDPDLREIERGEWVGRSLNLQDDSKDLSMRAWSLDPANLRPPGGENLRDVASRVLPRLDHWSGAYSGKTVAVVAHSWVIRVAICEALGMDLNRAPKLQLDTGAIVAMTWKRPADGEAALRECCLIGTGLSALPQERAWFSRPK
jgi:broad specificity phosphatase PhoE